MRIIKEAEWYNKRTEKGKRVANSWIFWITLFFFIGLLYPAYRYLPIYVFSLIAVVGLFIFLVANSLFFEDQKDWFESKQIALDFFQSLLVIWISVTAFVFTYKEYQTNYKLVSVETRGAITNITDTPINNTKAYLLLNGVRKECTVDSKGVVSGEFNVQAKDIANKIMVHVEADSFPKQKYPVDVTISRNATSLDMTYKMRDSTDLGYKG